MKTPPNDTPIHEKFLTLFRLGNYEKMLECWRKPDFGRWPNEPFHLERALKGLLGFIAVKHSPRINLFPLVFSVTLGQDGSIHIISTSLGFRVSEDGDKAVLGANTFLSPETADQLRQLTPDFRSAAIEIYKTHYEKIMQGSVDTIAEGLNP